MSKIRWRRIGSYRVDGGMTSWTCQVAVRPEGTDLWTVRWRGEEAEEQLLGPSTVESLTDELEEMFNADRDELLSLYSVSGIKDFEDFAETEQSE
jgi:hypothetical protein